MFKKIGVIALLVLVVFLLIHGKSKNHGNNNISQQTTSSQQSKDTKGTTTITKNLAKNPSNVSDEDKKIDEYSEKIKIEAQDKAKKMFHFVQEQSKNHPVEVLRKIKESFE